MESPLRICLLQKRLFQQNQILTEIIPKFTPKITCQAKKQLTQYPSTTSALRGSYTQPVTIELEIKKARISRAFFYLRRKPFRKTILAITPLE
jgi:hypothetical protein